MFDALFRQIKDRLFVSVAKMLDIPPNLITVFSLILGGLTVGFVLQKLYLAALMFWILNRLFDGLDGAIARIHQRQTDLGGYIDILSDFIIYAAIPISLVVITNYGTILLFDLDDPHFLRQCVFIDVPISNFGGADTGIKHTQRGHNGNYA